MEDVDFQLEPGRFDVLAGANGAGKSTLLQILAGLLSPSSGEVHLDDLPIRDLPLAARARRIGFLPQEIMPSFRYTVAETVALGARVAGTGHWFDREQNRMTQRAVEEALEQVEALDLRHRQLQELSGGERRRVCIASVLAQRPQYLLLDEPASMLDLHHQSELYALLRRLAQDGLGIGCVTHDWNLAIGFADRLTVLHDASILASGPPERILTAELLEQVFGSHFTILSRPDGRPAVVPR